MPNLPVIPNKAVLDSFLATDWSNYIQGLLTWVDVNRPITMAYQASGATQSIANNTFTAITFTQELIDRAAMHSTVTNTSRIVIGLEPGLYLCIGQVGWAANATGERDARILLNGVTSTPGGFGIWPPNGTALATSLAVALHTATVSTDYIELYGKQVSGGALSTAVSGDFTSWLLAIRLGS